MVGDWSNAHNGLYWPDSDQNHVTDGFCHEKTYNCPLSKSLSEFEHTDDTDILPCIVRGGVIDVHADETQFKE